MAEEFKTPETSQVTTETAEADKAKEVNGALKETKKELKTEKTSVEEKAYVNFVDRIYKHYRKGPEHWGKFLAAEPYLIPDAKSKTVRTVLSELVLKKGEKFDKAFENWKNKQFDANNPITSLATLLADTDFSGDVPDMPDADDDKYRNKFLRFGSGTRKLARETMRADVDGLFEGPKMVQLLKDAYAMIKVTQGVDNTKAEEIFVQHICELAEIKEISNFTFAKTFATIKTNPGAVDRLATKLNGLTGTAALWRVVYGDNDLKTKNTEEKQKTEVSPEKLKNLARERAKAKGIDIKKDGTEKDVEILLEDIAVTLGTGYTKDTLKTQYNEVLKAGSELCFNLTIASLQEKIVAIQKDGKVTKPDKDNKLNFLVSEIRKITENKNGFEKSYQQYFGTVFINMVQGVSTTLGVANSASLSSVAAMFRDKKFAPWMDKMSVTVGVGRNDYSNAYQVLNNKATKPSVTLGIGYADSKSFGKDKRLTAFYSIGASYDLVNQDIGAGATVGLGYDLNTNIYKQKGEKNDKNPDKSDKARSVMGENIFSGEAGVSVGTNGKGILPAPFLGLKANKEKAIASAKEVIKAKMQAVLKDQQTIKDFINKILVVGNGIKESDIQQNQQMKAYIKPLLDIIGDNPDTALIDQRASNCADAREDAQTQAMGKNIRLEGVNVMTIAALATNPTPIGLLVSAMSMFGKYGRPVARENKTSITKASENIYDGTGAKNFVITANSITGLNDLIYMQQKTETSETPATKPQIVYTPEKIQTSVGGVTFENTQDTITVPAGLFDKKSPVIYIDSLTQQYIRKNENNTITFPKELLHISLYEGSNKERQVVLNIGRKAGLTESTRITKFDEIKSADGQDPIKDWYELNKDAKYGSAIQALNKNMVPGEGNENQKMMKTLSDKGISLAKNSDGSIYIIEQADGKGDMKPYMMLQSFKNIEASKCFQAKEVIYGSTLIENKLLIPLESAVIIQEDSKGTFTMVDNKSVQPKTFSLKYENNFMETDENGFDADQGAIDADIYKVMSDHDFLMKTKYEKAGSSKHKKAFDDFRTAIDGNNLNGAKTKALALFPKIPSDKLNRANIRALDTAMCLISWTRDKSFESVDKRNTRMDELFKAVSFKDNNKKEELKTAAIKMMDTKNPTEDEVNTYIALLDPFVSGKLTTKKPNKLSWLKDGVNEKNPEYRLAWMLAPLEKVEMARREDTIKAINHSIPGLNTNEYIQMRDGLLQQAPAKKPTMSMYPDAQDLATYIDPKATPDQKNAFEIKNPDVYVAKNAIGLIFGYKSIPGKKGEVEIEEKFVSHPVLVKGLTNVMSPDGKYTDQEKIRIKYFMTQNEKIAPDMMEGYFTSISAKIKNLNSEFSFTKDDFNKIMSGEQNGKIKLDESTSITINPGWKEGFFVQCFNPTIYSELKVTINREKEAPSSIAIDIPDCGTPASNTINLTASTTQLIRTHSSISGTGTYAELKKPQQEILNATTESIAKYKDLTPDEIAKIKGILDGGPTITTATNEKLAAMNALTPAQKLNIQNTLIAKYGANRGTSQAAANDLTNFQAGLVNAPGKSQLVIDLFTGSLETKTLQGFAAKVRVPLWVQYFTNTKYIYEAKEAKSAYIYKNMVDNNFGGENTTRDIGVNINKNPETQVSPVSPDGVSGSEIDATIVPPVVENKVVEDKKSDVDDPMKFEITGNSEPKQTEINKKIIEQNVPLVPKNIITENKEKEITSLGVQSEFVLGSPKEGASLETTDTLPSKINEILANGKKTVFVLSASTQCGYCLAQKQWIKENQDIIGTETNIITLDLGSLGISGDQIKFWYDSIQPYIGELLPIINSTTQLGLPANFLIQKSGNNIKQYRKSTSTIYGNDDRTKFIKTQ